MTKGCTSHPQPPPALSLPTPQMPFCILRWTDVKRMWFNPSLYRLESWIRKGVTCPKPPRPYTAEIEESQIVGLTLHNGAFVGLGA